LAKADDPNKHDVEYGSMGERMDLSLYDAAPIGRPFFVSGTTNEVASISSQYVATIRN